MEPPKTKPIEPLTEQSIFRLLYKDPWVVGLQVALTILILVDYLYLGNLTRSVGKWFFLSLALSFLFIFTPKLPIGGLSRNYSVHFVFHLLTGYFLIFVVPIGSPYEIITLLLIYVSIYWYGTRGFWISFLANSVILALAVGYQIEIMSVKDFYELCLKILLLLLVGGILERLHGLDLTERRQLISVTREASYEHQRLRSLINSMADAVIAINQDGHVLIYNGATLDLLNTNLSLEHRPLKTVLHAYNKNQRPVDLIAQAQESTGIVKRDDLLIKVGREYLNIYASIARVQLGYGERGEEGFILLLRDITKEKSIEEQRDEFISVVSHELRTPLAITEATISTAMLPKIVSDKRQVADLLDQAHKNIIFLADMVNDITTLAHAERGDLDAEIEDVSPAEVIKELAENYNQEAKESGLTIKVVLGKGLPVNIRSNNYRVKEILQDFVTNAIKYTPKGKITLSAQPRPHGIRFTVSDTGIGISQSDQRHVFQKFWRSEDYRTRTHSGTGLGLYISKKLAARMRGSVGLTSVLDKGSTFYLDLPLDYNQSDSGSSAESKPHKP